MHRKQRTSEVKTDVRVLLDCLKCQLDNPDAVKQAFRTLAAIFTNVSGDEIKDYFRSLGGLEFIVSYNKTVTNVEVVEAALFCLGCAVENNVYSQKELTTSSQFTTLHRILSDDHSTTRLKHSASYLLLTLVSSNGVGQSLAKKTLCLSDLLGLLRTSLPSVCSKDHWFDDAGTTGFELWSSAITALCMCLNNPQNEENQRVCGFVLPYVFTVLQQSEEEKVIKPLLSLIRFTVANNETNQTHVKSCGGLAVLSEKLEKSTQQPKDTVSIPLINTIDACIADHGENAEEIRNLESVKLMMKLLSTENITQGEKLQIIVALVHAVEMADKNKEHILEESGLYSLMKSLNDIESGDDELFKAIKYLIQLCTNPEAQEPISESTEMLDILKKTEAMHRNSGMLLLNKINELSERLQTFEEVSARGYHHLTSSNPYMSDCQNLRPELIEYNCEIPTQIPIKHMIEEQENRYYLPRTSTPSSECRLMKGWKDNLLQENARSDKPYQSIPTVMMPLKQNMQQPHLNSFHGNLSASNLYHFPDDNLLDHFQDQDKNLPCPGKSQTRTKDLNGNLNIKSQYLNEVELSRLNPSILSDLYIPPNDYARYLVDGGNMNVDDGGLQDINDNGQSNYNDDQVTKISKNQCVYNLNEKGDSNLRNECITDIPHPVKNLTEVFDYDHQRYVVSKFSCSKDISGNGIRLGGQTDNSFCVGSHVNSSLDVLDGQMSISECFQGQQTSCDHFQHHSGSIQQKCHCILEHEQCADIEMTKKQKIDDMPLLSENREKPDRKKSGELNCDTDEQSIVECQQSDESRSIFLTGTKVKQGNARKPKKYEIRLVESESKNDSYLKKACLISKLSLNDTQTSNTNQSADSPVCQTSNKLQTNTNVVEYSCHSLISDATKPREKSVHVPLDKCRLGCNDESRNGKNMSNNSSLNPENEEQGQDSDDKFVKPVGRPLRRKKRSSVRRTQPFWKQQLISDTDTDNSCNESVFDEELITTAKKTIPNSSEQSNREYLCFSPDYLKTAQGNLQNGRCHDVLNNSHRKIPYSSSSSVYSSPGSVSSYMSSSSDKSPQKNNRCPGCIPSIPGLKLNSRTFNIVLETHPFTCQYHRTIREVERQFIKSIPRKSCTKERRSFLPYLSEVDKKEKRGLSVYEMSTDSENGEISPLYTQENENITASQMEQLPTPMRRKRVSFSEGETQNLLHGVEKFGKSWSLILQFFKFHTTRTAVDLKDKHRGIQNKSRNPTPKQKQRCKPFSMCEDRRLFRGIKLHGYNWKIILGTLRFSKERTKEDLRNRWRTLHKKNCIVEQ